MFIFSKTSCCFFGQGGCAQTPAGFPHINIQEFRRNRSVPDRVGSKFGNIFVELWPENLPQLRHNFQPNFHPSMGLIFSAPNPDPISQSNWLSEHRSTSAHNSER